MEEIDGRRLLRLDIIRAHDGDKFPAEDVVAREEPLEVRLNGQTLVYLMRLPGDEELLAAGYCFSEGLVRDKEQIQFIYYSGVSDGDSSEDSARSGGPRATSIRLFDEGAAEDFQIHPEVVEIRAELSREPQDGELGRLVMTGPGRGGQSAGVDVSDIKVVDEARFPVELLSGVPHLLLDGQDVFSYSGGTHGACIFDSRGNVLVVKEDVGRHNAVDKALGHLLLEGEPVAGKGMILSGRLSYEMVLKGARAGIPLLCSVSAPTSRGVEIARRTGVTIVGFLRGKGFNIYSHPDRIGNA